MQISTTVADLLDQQINAETYAAQLYTAVSTWADGLGFEGLAQWAMGESRDEQAHAQRFLDYANARDRATILAVAQPPVEYPNYAAALEALLTAEQAVSTNLTALHTAAMASADPATCLMAAQQLLDEQTPAEHRLSKALERVGRDTPIDMLDAILWRE